MQRQADVTACDPAETRSKLLAGTPLNQLRTFGSVNGSPVALDRAEVNGPPKRSAGEGVAEVSRSGSRAAPPRIRKRRADNLLPSSLIQGWEAEFAVRHLTRRAASKDPEPDPPQGCGHTIPSEWTRQALSRLFRLSPSQALCDFIQQSGDEPLRRRCEMERKVMCRVRHQTYWAEGIRVPGWRQL
jgi:hypothetical protein